MAKEKQLEQTKSLDNFATEKINVITNCLFGDYVEGEYVIPEEIKKELLDDKKVKKSVYKNSVFCNAYVVGYGDVVFEATFKQNTVKNVAKAELYVLENEYRVNGYIQNTIRTKIAEFVASIENFIENAYEYFHIVVTEDSDVKKYDLKEDISLNAYISAKKNFNLNMDKLTAKDYNKLYKKYVTARLEKLKKRKGNFSGQVLDRFNSEFAKIEKYFLRDGNYKAVSELLDKCIEDCVGVNPNFKKEEQEMFDDLTPLVEEFSREAAEIAESMHDRALRNLKKPERELEAQLEAQIRDGRYAEPPTTTTTPVKEERDYTSGSGGGGRGGSSSTDVRRVTDANRNRVGQQGVSREEIGKNYIKGNPFSLMGDQNFDITKVNGATEKEKQGKETELVAGMGGGYNNLNAETMGKYAEMIDKRAQTEVVNEFNKKAGEQTKTPKENSKRDLETLLNGDGLATDSTLNIDQYTQLLGGTKEVDWNKNLPTR